MAHHGARGPTVFGLMLSTMAGVRAKNEMRARVNVAHMDQPSLALDTSTLLSSFFFGRFEISCSCAQFCFHIRISVPDNSIRTGGEELRHTQFRVLGLCDGFICD